MNPDNYDPLAVYLQPSIWDRLRTKLGDSSARLHVALVIALVVVTSGVYVGFLRNPLVFDDYNLLNEATLRDLVNAPFTFGLRWLSNLSLATTYRLAGTEWLWYRVGNIALHTITAILLWHFVRHALESMKPSLHLALGNEWLAFLGALWFALHPVAVYGVGYLVERSIVMATLFAVAALLCYTLALERRKVGWFVAALACYFLALSSKEHAVMVPGAAIALSLYWRLPVLGKSAKLWLAMVLLSGLVAALALMFASYQKSAIGAAYEPQAFEIFTQMRERGTGANLDNAFMLSIATQAHLFFKYLLLWAIPYTGWMSIDIRQPFAQGLVVWPYGISLAAFVAFPMVAILLIRMGGRRGLFGVGMILPWILFLPELAVVRVTEIFVLYRSYLWMTGLPLMLVALASGMPKRIVAGIFPLLVIMLGLLAVNRLDTLSDHIKLWTDAIEANRSKIDQGAERAYFKRGLSHRELGRYDEAIADFKAGYALQSSSLSPAEAGDRGIMYFQFNYLVDTTEDLKQLKALNEEIQRNPGSTDAYLRRGQINLRLLRPLQAANDFSEAIARDPDNAGEARRSRAQVLFKSGGPAGPAAAIEDLNRAIAANPRFAKAYMTRGIVLAAQGNRAAALADLDKAISIAPNDAEIHFNRGNALVPTGRLDDALREYGKAIELDPKLADAYLNRAAILMHSGRLDEAARDLDNAITQNPDGDGAYFNRAKIRLARGDKDGALSDFGKVLKLNHQDKDALFERGLLLEEKGLIREARISLQRGCSAGSQEACAKLKEPLRG